MPSLKDYRDRIASVKSTRKITSAMKMVAASKLKRAQDQAEKSQPYAEHMYNMMARLAANIQITDQSPFLIRGTGKQDVHLLVVITSDRGLCGGFNAYVIRKAVQTIRGLLAEGKDVKIICVGRKGRDALRRQFRDKIIESFVDVGRQKLSFADAHRVAEVVLALAEKEEFDVCTILYNKFKSVISQVPTALQLVPFALPHANDNVDDEEGVVAEETGPKAQYEFEPDEETILAEILPRNLAIQIFRALLDSAAGEQAARMTAMDNATRNAGDRIDDLTLDYNRARQAYITKELIEIISGAEAL